MSTPHNTPKNALTRRALLRSSAVAAPATVLATPGLSVAARRRASDLPWMGAVQADDLASAIGVVVHFNYTDKVYGQTDRVIETVADLGVRHVRNRITTSTAGRRGFTEMAKLGVKVNGVCGAFRDPQTMSAVMAEVVRTYPDPTAVFSAFESINEPNNDGVPWITETRAKTRDLYLQRNAYGLQSIPILSPALARSTSGAEGGDTMTQSANLGDLSQYVDMGNIHVYPRGMTPSTDLDYFMAAQRNVTGNLPMVCTEGGYFTAENYSGGSNPVPASVAGKYVPRQIMEHWVRGNRRFFTYELLDDYDPTGADRESNLGLLRVSSDGTSGVWTPKPAYHAIRNFVSILGNPGESHNPGGMNISVTGVAGLKTVLAKKRNGAAFLLMWRDVNCYDHKLSRQIAVTDEVATVQLPNRRRVNLFNPTRSATPVKKYGDVSRVQVPVCDELVILKIV